MSEAQHAMTMADDDTMEALIGRAQRRLIIVAPGLSTPIAKAAAKQWRLLGPGAVSITLDIDPEVCRLGYGQIEAVALLARAAAELRTALNTHPGLSIGVVIADDETLIYAPTPQFIEAGPRMDVAAPIKPNAIRVGLPPADLERDLGAGPDGAGERVIGLQTARRERIREVQAELAALPPQPFNISRLLRVYTAHLEFVELRVLGCRLRRRTIPIPSDLVGLADEQTRRLLESKFRLVSEGDAGLWGEEILRLRDFIAQRFLVRLPGFGSVLRVRDKPRFELAVKALRKMLSRTRARKVAQVQAAIDRHMGALETALLPAVMEHPPARWGCGLFRPDPAQRLKEELMDLAGTARDMLGEARVELRYKGVTYETLNDPEFVAAVRRAMPDLTALHHERAAAPAMGG